MDYYSYRSPVIGLHVCDNYKQKFEDASISKISFGVHPYQKELVRHINENAITKSLQHACYLKTENSLSEDCYSAPSTEKQGSTIPINGQLPECNQQPPRHTTAKKMAQDYKYASTVFVKPHKRIREPKTTHREQFTPVSLDFLKTKRSPLIHQDLHASSEQAARHCDSSVKSEYMKRFAAAAAVGTTSNEGVKNLSGVRGCAKLNITHNIITGDRHSFFVLYVS